MYKQTKATSKIRLSKGGSIVCPIATLKDEYGGVCHIAEDDHCYVLYQNNSDGTYSLATHIFKEAFEVLRNLPSPTISAFTEKYCQYLVNCQSHCQTQIVIYKLI